MNTTPESQELSKILDNTDASNTHLIQFLPNGLPTFRIETENIKKLALYITNKLNKTSFDPGELEHAFGFITKNLKSTLSQDEYEHIKQDIENFIRVGGKIEIAQNPPLSNNYSNYLHVSLIVSIVIIIIQNIPVILWLLFVLFTMIIFVISTEGGLEATLNAMSYAAIGLLMIAGLALIHYLLSKKPNIYSLFCFIIIAIFAIGFGEYNLGGNSSFAYLLEYSKNHEPKISYISDEIITSKEDNQTKLKVIVGIEDIDKGKFEYKLHLVGENGNYNRATCSIQPNVTLLNNNITFECISGCSDNHKYCQIDHYKSINSMTIETWKIQTSQIKEKKRIWETGVILYHIPLPLKSKDIFLKDYYNDIYTVN